MSIKDKNNDNLILIFKNYSVINNEDNQNINGYITKILNHQSPESSLSYSNYKYIPNKEQADNKRIKKKIL